MRLGLWQGASPAGAIAVGVATLERAFAAAGAAGAQYLVASEVCLPGYNQPDSAHAAMPRTDPVLRYDFASAGRARNFPLGLAQRKALPEFHAAAPVDFLAWAALVFSAALPFLRTLDPASLM